MKVGITFLILEFRCVLLLSFCLTVLAFPQNFVEIQLDHSWLLLMTGHCHAIVTERVPPALLATLMGDSVTADHTSLVASVPGVRQVTMDFHSANVSSHSTWERLPIFWNVAQEPNILFCRWFHSQFKDFAQSYSLRTSCFVWM